MLVTANSVTQKRDRASGGQPAPSELLCTERQTYGGETGIRTLGTREGSTVFETAPFDHSGTSPRGSTEAAFSRE